MLAYLDLPALVHLSRAAVPAGGPGAVADPDQEGAGGREVGVRQGSEKWGRWGRIFPDKAKSHGQFEPKQRIKFTYSQTDRQTDRKIGNIIPG